jgi:hypothetical protein
VRKANRQLLSRVSGRASGADRRRSGLSQWRRAEPRRDRGLSGRDLDEPDLPLPAASRR